MIKCLIQNGLFLWEVITNTGGMFNTYATVQGADRIIPVDIYLQDALQDLKLYNTL